MKKRIHQFLMALLWLFMPEVGRPKNEDSIVYAGAPGYKTRRSRPGIEMKGLYNPKCDSATMSQQQCILLIQSVSRILREEAEKKGLKFYMSVEPADPKKTTFTPE